MLGTYLIDPWCGEFPILWQYAMWWGGDMRDMPVIHLGWWYPMKPLTATHTTDISCFVGFSHLNCRRTKWEPEHQYDFEGLSWLECILFSPSFFPVENRVPQNQNQGILTGLLFFSLIGKTVKATFLWIKYDNIQILLSEFQFFMVLYPFFLVLSGLILNK